MGSAAKTIEELLTTRKQIKELEAKEALLKKEVLQIAEHDSAFKERYAESIIIKDIWPTSEPIPYKELAECLPPEEMDRLWNRIKIIKQLKAAEFYDIQQKIPMACIELNLRYDRIDELDLIEDLHIIADKYGEISLPGSEIKRLMEAGYALPEQCMPKTEPTKQVCVRNV